MGQAKKKLRECPAVGRTISAAECGENRASRYACPADCPHNPWSPANYDHALQIEDATTVKMYRRLAEERGGPLPQSEIEGVMKLTDLGREMHFLRTFQQERDATGRSFAERWAAAGFGGLNNDERKLFQWKTGARVRLLEVLEVRADAQCLARDLLDPATGTLVLQDRSLQGMAVRFAQFLGWTFAPPHYTRVLGIALPVPEVSDLDSDEVVRLVVQHCGGPTGAAEMRTWLETHFLPIEQSFHAIQAALRYQMFKNVDARFTQTSYRLTRPVAELLRRLDECAAVQPDDPSAEDRAEGFTTARVWFDESAPVEPGQQALPLTSVNDAVAGRPVLGRVLLAPERGRLDAGSGARAAALRAQFEKRAGRMAEYVGERVDDLGARLLQKQPVPDLRLVPAGLLEKAPRIVLTSSRLNELPASAPVAEAEAHVRRRHDELFLADRIPALNGLTPRQAAADPQWRPALVRLVKQRIRHEDQHNLESGDNYDANWLVRELGLTEILFDPPPPRPPPVEDADGEFDDEDDFPLELDESLPPSPPLPPARFTAAEVEARLAAVREKLADPAAASIALQDGAPHIFELLDEALPEAATDQDFTVLIVLGAIVWHVFVPPGTRGWWIDHDQFFPRLVQRGEVVARNPSPQEVERMLTGSRQPVLAGHVADLLAKLVADKRQKARLDPAMSIMMLAILLTLIDELDEAARA